MQSGQSQILKKYYSLLELTQSIESVLKKTYTASYWVKAEIAKLNYYPKSGHCYPDLVEKENGVVLAQIRATIWAGQFNDINSKFIKVTKEPLSDGMTVLIRTSVSFHPVYGLSLHIVDIEPSFTLGEMAKEKQQSIDKLLAQGIFHSNKQLVPPVLIRRLAVISVETSKGYHDFIKVIDHNDWNYKFFHMLFPALLQGEGAITSIIEQLGRIKKVLSHFDAVLIIRGGGGDVGLSSFDNFKLASAIARFPLPIITGIGHATNQTVVEQISYINKITPTEVGYYLIQRYHNFSVRIQEAQNSIIEKSTQISIQEKHRLRSIVTSLKSGTDALNYYNRRVIAESQSSLKQYLSSLFERNRNILHLHEINLNTSCGSVLVASKFKLESFSEKIKLLAPQNVLKRGYSITTINGKALIGIDELNVGDEIETITYQAKIKSKVHEINKNKK